MGIRIYSEGKGLVERNLFLGEKVKKKLVACVCPVAAQLTPLHSLIKEYNFASGLTSSYSSDLNTTH